MKYFVYFSYTGNGDYLASLLKEKGYEPVKVEALKPMKKVNFFRILKYGGRAMAGKREPIKDFSLDLKENDEVIIGSPIWNDRLSTPILSVLDKLSLNKETTKFILYPAGLTTNKSKEQIKKMGFKENILVVPYPTKYQDGTKALLENL